MSTAKSGLRCTLAALGLMLSICGVQAQSYPDRAIRLVVPFPPAGSNDIVGRVVGGALGERIGKQVVIDNRAGGNSIIGTELVANGIADGGAVPAALAVGATRKRASAST